MLTADSTGRRYLPFTSFPFLHPIADPLVTLHAPRVTGSGYVPSAARITASSASAHGKRHTHDPSRSCALEVQKS